jgi:MFS family permease
MDLMARVREEMAFESNIWKSYLYRFLMNFQLWWPIWVIYLLRQRGLSLTQVTLLDTPFFLLIVFAEVPTGAIADRFGRRVSLILGSALFAVAVFVFGIADNFAVILVSYTAWGLALTFQSGADSALLYDSLKSVGREDDFPKINRRLWAVTSFGVLLAIIVGAPLAGATSYAFPIVLSAGIALLAVPVAFSMHEAPRGQSESQERYFQTLLGGIRSVWSQPSLRYIFLFSGVVGAATFIPLVFQQPFLAHHGVSVGNLGLWQAPVRGAGVASALGAGWFVSRLGTRGAFFALPVMLGVCDLALAGLDYSVVAGAFLGVGAVAGSQFPILAAYVNERIPSERRATMLSVQSLVYSVIIGVTLPLAGLIADQYGLRAVFLVLGVVTLIGCIIPLVLWSRAESKELAELEEMNRALLGIEHTRERVPAS